MSWAMFNKLDRLKTNMELLKAEHKRAKKYGCPTDQSVRYLRFLQARKAYKEFRDYVNMRCYS
jgi:hypothetical protein